MAEEKSASNTNHIERLGKMAKGEDSGTSWESEKDDDWEEGEFEEDDGDKFEEAEEDEESDDFGEEPESE